MEQATLAAAPGLLLLALCCVPRVQDQLRYTFTQSLRQCVFAQLPWVSWAQSSKSPSTSSLVNLSASTITVEFFLLLLPMLIWSGFEELCIQMTLVLSMGTYLTCALKDIFCCPRPTSLHATGQMKDVASRTLDASVDEVEYGAPSLHVSITICMTMRMIIYFTHEQTALPSPPSWTYLAAIAWIIWIGWGRLYLAAHTPVDLVLGVGVGCSILSTCVILGPPFAAWIATSPYSLPVHLLGSFLLLRTYPLPEEYTTSYLYATTFLGAWFGFATFLRTRAGTLDPSALCPVLENFGVPLLSPELLLAAKILFGYTLALFTKIAAKQAIQGVLQKALDLFPAKLRKVWSIRVAPLPKSVAGSIKKPPPDLEVMTKFFSYASVALVVAANANVFDSAALCFSAQS